MVAVIKTGHSIHRILNYNENKVKEGLAQCIAAINYPIDLDQLSFNNKLNRLLNQTALNENVTRKSVHISLNFPPCELHSIEKLIAIAGTYMNKIGFGEQPYLIYQHLDAGHPHIHMVTIKIKEDGSRIDTQNIGRNQSETARKEIEEKYGLKKANTDKREVYTLQPIQIEKIDYGKSQIKRAVTIVLDRLIYEYKFSSLPELNALLKLYNVHADQGKEGSRIYNNRGLVYRVLDKYGNKTGVPIKASDFYNKPTLCSLQERFTKNEQAKQPYKERIKKIIEEVLLKYSSLELVIHSLKKAGIDTIIRKNNEGIIYGLTYIDHHTKCVFNGSDLGKNYSAAEVIKYLLVKENNAVIKAITYSHDSYSSPSFNNLGINGNTISDNHRNPLEVLFENEKTPNYLPYALRAKRKRKRNKL